MTVQWPAEYRDATINGVIGRITLYGGGHNTELRVCFDSIRMRGQTTDFEGVLSSVRMPGGASLRWERSSARLRAVAKARRSARWSAVSAA